ncbi:MAG: S8 family serine peptidase [candidate division KSB1 bacterium]|nr:S8 family serine peptidase [candidate division KSB1 bacterium]MDZ7300847.1 S8 family serine peptidase [candidate division KSB1 bacterium]
MSSKRLLLLLAALMFILPVHAEKAGAAEQYKYWIFFRDKGPEVLSKRSALLDEAQKRLSPRALQRRAKVLPATALVDESDIDLYQPYLNELAGRGFSPIVTSRWLNAVSIWATPEEAAALQSLPFVKGVQRVASLKIPPAPEAAPEPPQLFKIAAHRFEYGASLAQMEQIRATILHDAGIFGIGVIVGMMDSGFQWRKHEAFANLKVLAEWDVAHNDSLTSDEAGQDCPGEQSHGTQTLSVIAGFAPGNLIGPAFGARYLLAKTEIDRNVNCQRSETNAEEDNWAQAVEWMEELGVEVTSTSLGYSTFDEGQRSYTPGEMDGKTAIITKAAEMAARKGVIVVNAAGNEGGNSWRIIAAPADGAHVIAVGAVYSTGDVTYFSSRGPTADGRIKPDVMAMGSGVRVVSPGSTNQYGFNEGTSFACPLAAGVVAQILSAHPEVTPDQMINVLHATSSMANAPNKDYGYGIVNAVAAITSLGPAFSNLPHIDTLQPGMFDVTMRVLSRDGIQPGSMKICYAPRGSGAYVTVPMAPQDSISYVAQIPRPAHSQDTLQVYFTATDFGFGDVSYPKRAPAQVFLVTRNGLLPISTEGPRPLPSTFFLAPTRPNPFGSLNTKVTRLSFDLPLSGLVRIRIYNILGQRVRTLFEAQLPAGHYENFTWDGTDDLKQPVAGGVYIFEVSTPVGVGRRKILLLR